MKKSQILPDTFQGKLVRNMHGLGTVTPNMVEQRARELAVINGRNGNDFTEADREQALTELTGDSSIPDYESIDTAPSNGFDGPTGGLGKKIPVRGAADEQEFAEELVAEGVEEAAHTQSLAAASIDPNQDN